VIVAGAPGTLIAKAGLAPAGQTGSVLLRQDVIPLVSVAVLFGALLAWWVRTGAARHRAQVEASAAGPPPPFRRLVGHVLRTAAAGYVVFLFIVVAYYEALGGQTRSFLTQALWGGAFLAFVVAVPVMLASGAALGRRSGRTVRRR
jgi:hypothetical protein